MMNFKIISISSLPAVFFLLGIIYLVFSPLTVQNAINLQYDVFDVFISELMKTEMSTAIVTAFKYLWNNALLTVIFFLVLITIGLVCYVYFYKNLDFKVVIVSQALFLIISIIITKFSLTIATISVSLFLGILWMHKTFEPGKNNFTTCYSVVASRLNLLGIFLSIGVFIAIFMNMQVYENQMVQSNLKFFVAFIPNATEIKKAQAGQIEDMTDGFKSSLVVQYENLQSDVRTQCKPMYDAMIVGIDDYKRQAVAQINEQQVPVVGMGDILQQFPLFDLLVKITPLLIAFSAYALISILNPLLGIFGGIVYSAIKRVGPE
jgi:hypothetical protein